MKRSISFSQNFLHSPKLVKSLIAKTNISDKDTVYDIGAGKGIITSALSSKCHTVIAVEPDHKLVRILQKNLQDHPNVLVYESSFLDLPLPETKYKVFANIPFNLSADILHRLIDAPNPPVASYLVVQKEFANKLITKSGGSNSQLAILLGAQFRVQIVEELNPNNFYPIPKITSAFIEILRRPSPLVATRDLQLFRNFVMYIYNTFKPTISDSLSPIFSKNEFAQATKDLNISSGSTPTQLDLQKWLSLFSMALKKRNKLEKLVNKYEKLFGRKHATMTKLHRTRLQG